jgi:hypothetical protein
VFEGKILINTFKYLLMLETCKGKAIPLQALTGREDSRRLRIPDFKTLGI